ncbi:MAG: nucleotidyltransferase family protein [Enhydrobacter sp.]|nr:MAG: nucleotidyltransferase family protein [Enhydrobacter sp.]
MPPVQDIIAQDPVGMEQLRAARALGLPDWCIAAGFVRNRVWDHLHGIHPPRPVADIDVIYFDAADVSRETEARHEARLAALMPGQPWQARNQARMHVWKGLPPHRSTADSMLYWLETVTPVGVRLEADDTLTLVAPLGIDDLLNLVCRPTAFGRTRRDEYEARIASKRWGELWPKVRFLD